MQLLQAAAKPECELANPVWAGADVMVAVAKSHHAGSQERNRAAAQFAALRDRLEDCLTKEEREGAVWPAVLARQRSNRRVRIMA